MRRTALTGLAALAGAVALAGAPDAFAQDAVERGEYLVRAAGCIACHTAKDGGQLFAGGYALKTPFGTFYSPNITPDRETGIGAWTDEDFVGALHEGKRPAGGRYFPVFPYTSYTKMTREDALAIKAYLFSLDPVSQPNRDHGIMFPFSMRILQRGWQMVNFEAGRFEPDPGASDPVNRGAYLAQALAHCGECHTPRNMMGATDEDMYLAGTPDGPEGEVAPNITPHSTGIGDWSEADIAELLKSGFKPDFDNVQGTMDEAIEDGLKYLTDADRAAIAAYLKSVPPIDNKVGSGG
ncbi:MAG: c-type cytochrome [Minwuia sp.]|uniref:c-type cytochrome n=1 Tax=Minwuia sp. TaxID=2493630 RepID=UPI003A863382